MIRPLLAAAAVLAAGQAAALTCVPPDPVRGYLSADAAEESYVVLFGRFAFDDSLMPDGTRNDPPPPPPVAAEFDGHSLTIKGFTAPVSRPVTLQPVCLGPWCGRAADGVTALAYARSEGGALTIEVAPCNGAFFPDPSPADIAAVEACIAGGACEPGPRTR